MNILLTTQLRPGANSLVTLIQPIMTKGGIETRYLHGPVWVGRPDNEVSKQARVIQIGTQNERGDHIIVPLSSVVSIQECNKVLNSDKVVVIP